jgi:hypothetical protein
LSQDDPLSNKEEACEIDRVKVEVVEEEVTVEEHGITLDGSDDSTWLVGISDSGVCLQYIDLALPVGPHRVSTILVASVV